MTVACEKNDNGWVLKEKKCKSSHKTLQKVNLWLSFCRKTSMQYCLNISSFSYEQRKRRKIVTTCAEWFSITVPFSTFVNVHSAMNSNIARLFHMEKFQTFAGKDNQLRRRYSIQSHDWFFDFFKSILFKCQSIKNGYRLWVGGWQSRV